jgi:hypothetical protein
MQFLPYFFLLLVISGNVLAGDLSKSQCEKTGGTFTEVGCLMLNESDKVKFKNSKIRMASKEECKCQGGIWNEKTGCMFEISKEQCESVGGKMQAGIGCVELMTQEKCKELGGIPNKTGGCVLNQKPNLFSSGTAEKQKTH